MARRLSASRMTRGCDPDLTRRRMPSVTVAGMVIASSQAADPSARPWFRRPVPFLRYERRAGPDGIDGVIAAACFVVFTLPVISGVAGGHGSTAAIAVLGVLAVAPLIARRRWPLVTLAAVSAVLCVAALVDVRFTPFVSNAGPALAVAVITIADRRSRAVSLIATGAAIVVISVAALIALYVHPGQDQDVVQLLIAVPAWLLGDASRARRGYNRSLAAEASRQTAEKERRVRAEERLRVSRDVHDLVSHTLSMIAIRSGVARLLINEQPEEAGRALHAIETASRSALTELRQVLSQVRVPGPLRVGDEPGMADVEELVDGLRHSGLTLDYRVDGDATRYPAILETSAYRIVQEALTNVVKHAHAQRAWIGIRHESGELVVSVIDDGTTAAAAAQLEDVAGLGLAGMRERVALFDGRLEAGPNPDGGFTVRACFPIGPSADD